MSKTHFGICFRVMIFKFPFMEKKMECIKNWSVKIIFPVFKSRGDFWGLEMLLRHN